MQDGSGSVIEAIGRIHVEKSTGTLEIEQGAAKRKFFFMDGELYLPGGHALAQHLGRLIEGMKQLDGEGVASDPAGEVDARRSVARDQLQAVVRRIVDVLVEWEEGVSHFVPSEGPPALDLVGPLPTAYLIMDGSVRDLSESEMLEALGGESALVVADTASDLLQRLTAIDPGDMFVISRAESPVRVGELLRQVPGGRASAVRSLCRLASIGLVRPVAAEDLAVEAIGSRILDSMVDRFIERVRARLEDAPTATLPEAEHRARVARLIGSFGGMNYYELLGVATDAPESEIYDAYLGVATLVHPDHATRVGLGSKPGTLRLLFERATEAYLCLGDPERRAEYNRAAGVEFSRSPEPEARTAEQRQMAEECFRRAQDFFHREELQFALELAWQAVRAHPKASYFALLGRIQARNPQWVSRALESFRQASRMDPENADYRVDLGKLMEATGEWERARMHYRAALQLSPGHGEAMECVERLDSVKHRGTDDSNWLIRLRELFGSR